MLAYVSAPLGLRFCSSPANMESFNATRLQQLASNNTLLLIILNASSNDSTLEQSGLNRSVDVNNLPSDSDIITTFPTALIFVLALGIPGNFLVLAIYAFNMTTSTRVYMFALAVADSAVCICGLILATVPHYIISLVVSRYLTVMAVAFSGFLLSFVSIERLLAVRHPHTFSLSSLRAKRALWIIAIGSGVCSLGFCVARITNNLAALRMVAAVLIASTATVIIICYTLLALTIMMQARDARRNVGVTRTKPAVATTNTTAGVSCRSNSSTTTTKKVTAYKNVAVLFLITIAFLLSWMPVFLVGIGIFPRYEILIRVYLINSLINPFIYSAVSRMFRKDVLLFYRLTCARLTMFCN